MYCRVPLRFVLAALFLGAFWLPLGFAAQGITRDFPPGAVSSPQDLPAGRFRSHLEQLPDPARQRALAWLRSFHFTELDLESLQIDSEGGVFYADTFDLQPAAAQAPATSEAAVPVSPFPTQLILHSRPGAPNVLYLDFDGENVTGTQWNTELARTTIPAVAFSTDADFTTFSDSEQMAIKRMWLRIAEDYAPFNVDVTTERPSAFTIRTAHALITRNTDANNESNPSSNAGGVAYVNAFNTSSYARYRPAWIYYNNLANDESYTAEAASHEIGHNLGLSHDGQTGSAYYGGHGSGDTSWGPLMGTGYNQNVSQWSKGEYYQASNTEDDLAIIAAKVSYRSDDHGGSFGTATPLVILNGTNVSSTTPETDPANTNKTNKGVIERATDWDVFSFSTGGGAIKLNVNPWIMPAGSRTRGGNLDVLVELFDATGTLLATNNPALTTYASIQTTLPAGQYYLQVRNSGAGNPAGSSPTGYTAYGSVGQFYITGTVASGLVPPPVATLQVTNVTQPVAGPITVDVLYSDSVAISGVTISDNDVRITGPAGYDQLGRLVALDASGNGSPRRATYAIAPPNGSSWTLADNGPYTVWMRTNEVSNADGVWVAGGQLGQFSVNIRALVFAESFDQDPGWTLEPQWEYGVPNYSGNGPAAGFTGAAIIGYNLSGNYENRINSPKFASSRPVNAWGHSGLHLSFRRWLGLQNGDTALIQVSTNGTHWTDIWSTSSAVADSSWQLVEYPLPDWTGNQPALQFRWGLASNQQQNNIGWNIDDVQILADFVSNVVPNVQLTTTVVPPGAGTVSPASGSFAAGASVQLEATPSPYYAFQRWTTPVTFTANPYSLTLVSNVLVTAEFRELQTAVFPTPYWWLAAYGYTNFEAVVTNMGPNGMPVWQSYIAGLNPTNPASQLLLVTEAGPNKAIVLRWGTVPDRLYHLLWSPAPHGVYATLSGASNLSPTVTSFTNLSSTNSGFYRLQVTKP